MKYRKLPVEIEAHQFNFIEDLPDLFNFTDGALRRNNDGDIIVKTLEGEHIVSKYDYIIKGVKGEFYPCKPDIFKMTYEAV